MKNTLFINGELVMPIRAIPAHSPGMFEAKDVADMLCCVEHFPYAPALRPFRMSKDGHPIRMHPAQFLHACSRLQSDENIEGLEAIRHLPRGVFVRVAEIKERFDFLDDKISERDLKCGYQEIPRAWIDEPDTTPEEEAVFFEAIHVPARLQVPMVRGQRRDRKGIDPLVQETAEVLTKDFKAKNNRQPTKKQLAPLIKEKLKTSKSVETIMREFKTIKH